MYIRKPSPMTALRAGNACPVCGHASYSRGGVHPQCSALLVDKPFHAAQQRERELEKPIQGKG